MPLLFGVDDLQDGNNMDLFVAVSQGQPASDKQPAGQLGSE